VARAYLVATDASFDSLLYGCTLALWGNPALAPTDTPEKVWKYRWFPSGLAISVVTAIYYGVEISSGRLRKRLSVFSRA
jgi:hypothetical protein